MASFSTNEFKPGLKVILDGDPCSILENEYVKPGKGQAFNRVKLRNLKNGAVIDRTFNAGIRVEQAVLDKKDMQFLYRDGDDSAAWHGDTVGRSSTEDTMVAIVSLGARRVFAYCTHPVFSGPAVERISRSQIDEVVITNTIPLNEAGRECAKIRQLSVAFLFAETIRRISDGESVTSLFAEQNSNF